MSGDGGEGGIWLAGGAGQCRDCSLFFSLEDSGWPIDVLYLRIEDGDVADSAALDM